MKEIRTKHKFSLRGLLAYINDQSEAFFPTSRKNAYYQMYHPKYIDLDNYFPSEIIRAANRLERKGLVKIESSVQGTKVIITDKGKTETLKYEIDTWQPKSEKWDGKWRIVFFDIEETQHHKRNKIVKYLKQLGLQEMQKSLYIIPYDISHEIKYLREVFGVPHQIKYGVLEFIENSAELKLLFGL